MIRRILLAAVALATIGTSIAAEAQPARRDHHEARRGNDRHDIRHDRREVRHAKHDQRRHRYFHNGRYYDSRSQRNGIWIYR